MDSGRPRTGKFEPIYSDNNERVGRQCSYKGCLNTTAQKKPYCLDHLMLNPYASKIHSEIRDFQADLERLKKAKKIHLKPTKGLGKEIIKVMSGGGVSLMQITEELGVDRSLLKRAVHNLVRSGYIKEYSLKRRRSRGYFYALTEKGQDEANKFDM